MIWEDHPNSMIEAILNIMTDNLEEEILFKTKFSPMDMNPTTDLWENPTMASTHQEDSTTTKRMAPEETSEISRLTIREDLIQSNPNRTLLQAWTPTLHLLTRRTDLTTLLLTLRTMNELLDSPTDWFQSSVKWCVPYNDNSFNIILNLILYIN